VLPVSWSFLNCVLRLKASLVRMSCLSALIDLGVAWAVLFFSFLLQSLTGVAPGGLVVVLLYGGGGAVDDVFFQAIGAGILSLFELTLCFLSCFEELW